MKYFMILLLATTLTGCDLQYYSKYKAAEKEIEELKSEVAALKGKITRLNREGNKSKEVSDEVERNGAILRSLLSNDPKYQIPQEKKTKKSLFSR